MLKKTLTKVVTDKIGGDLGVGKGEITHFLEGSELPKNAPLMASIILEPGASIGYHKHTGEGEMYYIISGNGTYTEDGKDMPISAGMVTMVYDGQSHGLKNSPDSPLEMLAMIISD